MLDASAIIAYLRAETGADAVEDLLADEDEPCFVHAINLCEVYYKMQRYEDEAEVRSAIQEFRSQGLVVKEDLDEPFWIEVGGYKAAVGSVPLADCFVAALANRLEAEAVTADRGDFGRIKEQGLCKVRFIR